MFSNKTLRRLTETQTAIEKTKDADFVDLITTLSLTHPDVLVENDITVTIMVSDGTYGE